MRLGDDTNIDTDPDLTPLAARPLPVITGPMASKRIVDVIADLNQTISNPPTQAEVQAISDKVDEILAEFKAAGHIRA